MAGRPHSLMGRTQPARSTNVIGLLLFGTQKPGSTETLVCTLSNPRTSKTSPQRRGAHVMGPENAPAQRP
jgi:hypothetical protein